MVVVPLVVTLLWQDTIILPTYSPSGASILPYSPSGFIVLFVEHLSCSFEILFKIIVLWQVCTVHILRPETH
jgi:hypothetical protein